MPNLSLAKNGTFKSVSIQAAEWMKLSEVVPNDLHAYLVQMKSKGYQVVALEQTSTSIPLQEYTVPSNEKVVLLLGKTQWFQLLLLSFCVSLPYPRDRIRRYPRVVVAGCRCLRRDSAIRGIAFAKCTR